jgi:hypothetical protein
MLLFSGLEIVYATNMDSNTWSVFEKEVGRVQKEKAENK